MDSEFADFSGTSNGGSATALIGKPIGESRWNPNVYAGAGISNYGSQGWNIRLGIDLQPTFLLQNRRSRSSSVPWGRNWAGPLG